MAPVEKSLACVEAHARVSKRVWKAVFFHQLFHGGCQYLKVSSKMLVSGRRPVQGAYHVRCQLRSQMVD